MPYIKLDFRTATVWPMISPCLNASYASEAVSFDDSRLFSISNARLPDSWMGTVANAFCKSLAR